MAFDEGLAERVRALLADDTDTRERWSGALSSSHTREMDFTDRSMKGMIYVGVAGFAEDEDLATWVERGTTFARSLPPK